MGLFLSAEKVSGLQRNNILFSFRRERKKSFEFLLDDDISGSPLNGPGEDEFEILFGGVHFFVPAQMKKSFFPSRHSKEIKKKDWKTGQREREKVQGTKN